MKLALLALVKSFMDRFWVTTLEIFPPNPLNWDVRNLAD